MSTAPADVTPGTESSPVQPPERPELAPPSPGHSRRVFILAIVAVALLVLAGMLAAVLRSRTTGSPHGFNSLSLNDPQVLRLKGTTEAVQSRAILAPLLEGQKIPTLTIVHMLPAGTWVKRGDLLVEFDRQAQIRDYVDKKANYDKLVDQVAEEQAKESAARAKDETELTQAEDSLRKAELEVQKAEIVSRIDAEKNQETLEEARATYDQLRQTFDLKRKAAQAAIRILQIQRDRTQQTMLHAQANSDLMQIRSPLDGVVVLNTIWKQGNMGEVQEGDQVRPGVPFMQVVDPSSMQVRVLANQEDFPSLRVGEMATVRLDAYPDMAFHGKLDQLAPIGETGDFSTKLRVFVVIFSIQGHDPKLMPDLSAAVDVNLKTTTADTHSTGQDAARSGT